MRWGDMRRSENIEDRGSGGFPMGGGGMRIGLGGIIIALIASVLFGVNPLDILGGMQGGPVPAPRTPECTAKSRAGAAGARCSSLTRRRKWSRASSATPRTSGSRCSSRSADRAIRHRRW